MLRLLEAQARTAHSASIAIFLTAVSLLFLVAFRKTLDKPTLSEVMLVSLVDHAPLARPLFAEADFWGPPPGFHPVGGLLQPSVARAVIAFRLFFLFPGLAGSEEAGSSRVLHRSLQL